MAVTLLIVFRSRLRLLPLAIALAAVGITFGATSLLGGSLTMASIAVLPILIGLAVDYAIQFQSRVQEARRSDRGRADGRPGDRPRRVAEHADDRDRGAGDRDRLPRAAALARADGARVRRAARGRHRDRACLRADGGLRRDGARRAGRRRRLGVAPRRLRDCRRGRIDPRGPRARGRASRRPSRRASAPRANRRRIGLPRDARRRGASAGPGAGGRCGARRAGVGRRHPDLGAVGRHEAGPLEHARVARPAPARARHGRVRRDRRGRPLARRRDAEDDRLDAVLREQAPVALRVPRDEGVLEGHAVSGAVAARPVLLGHAADGDRMRGTDRGLDQARS